MTYSMEMGSEKPPVVKKLLPEGERVFIIESCEPSKSKAGNDMFVIELKDKETGYVDKIFPISTAGKRWFLKTILTACGIEAGQDGVYSWDIPDILGKEVLGVVSHEQNEFTNREGIIIKGTQHRINEIKTLEWDR